MCFYMNIRNLFIHGVKQDVIGLTDKATEINFNVDSCRSCETDVLLRIAKIG